MTTLIRRMESQECSTGGWSPDGSLPSVMLQLHEMSTPELHLSWGRGGCVVGTSTTESPQSRQEAGHGPCKTSGPLAGRAVKPVHTLNNFQCADRAGKERKVPACFIFRCVYMNSE